MVFLSLVIVGFVTLGAAQTPPAAQVRVIGEVVALDADARLMSVKNDAGEVFTLVFEDETQYLRVPPGEKTLDKAVPATLGEIGRGDRVYARGQPLPDGKTLPTRQLVVMVKAAIEKKHDQDREEWRRRGIVGTITEVRANKKEVVVEVRSQPVPQSVVVPVSEARFRRYAPDSVKFSEAKSGSFAELKVGDQLRALGERSPDGAVYKAQQIVSGSFRTIGGTVTAVNPETNEIKIAMVPGRQVITVVLNKDSVMRRFPAQFAAMMAQRMSGGMSGGGGRMAGPGGSDGLGGPRGGQRPATGPGPDGAPAAPSGVTRPAGGPAGAGANGGPPGAGPSGPAARGMQRMGGPGGGGPGGPGGDVDLLDRLPPLTVAEIKPGEAVMVASTAGKDPSRVTAIAFVAGVEAFLNAAASAPARAAGPSQSLGLPGGALDMSFGLP